MNRRAAAAVLALALCGRPAAAADLRVLSLDQCADQYVMALAPRAAIVGVSPRADDADSWLRAEARGLPRRRATLESVLAARPTVVVRQWGGDPRLIRELERRGVRVVGIDDATDFDGVRADVRHIAGALGRAGQGEALVRDMDRKLDAARGVWGGARALYLTSGGFTAGPGTLIDAMLRAAGLTNAATAPGFAPVKLEGLVLKPPSLFVLGFFDDSGRNHWSGGRNPVMRRLAAGRTAAELPASMLGCPGWFAADGALKLAQARPR